MYKVIKFFTDLHDNDHPYNVGDTFPREGIEVSDARLKELAGKENKQGAPLIELVEEPKQEAPEKAPEEPEQEAPEKAPEEPEQEAPEKAPEEPEQEAAKEIGQVPYIPETEPEAKPAKRTTRKKDAPKK